MAVPKKKSVISSRSAYAKSGNVRTKAAKPIPTNYVFKPTDLGRLVLVKAGGSKIKLRVSEHMIGKAAKGIVEELEANQERSGKGFTSGQFYGASYGTGKAPSQATRKPPAKRVKVQASARASQQPNDVAVVTPGGEELSVSTVAVAVAQCAEVLGSQSALASWLGVARSQPGRWLVGKEYPSPVAAGLLLDLAYVAARGRRTWSTATAVRSWLTGSEPLLDGAVPLDVLKRDGPRRLIAALDAEMAGSFA